MRFALAATTLALAAAWAGAAAAPIPARYPEGVTHGFLVLRDLEGNVLAHGDLVQLPRGTELDKRMVFQFKDGSVLDESVTLTQDRVFALKEYHLVEKGPTFPADTEIKLTAGSGAYRVTTSDRKDGDDKVLEGKLELPADVYNGMVMTVVKDLPPGSGEVVHFVAFTPQPRIIELAFTRAGEEKVQVGGLTRNAAHFVVKPRLGPWLKFFATILRRAPPDLHAWILETDAPAFVAFEGVVGTTNDVWRIETVSPTRGNDKE